MGRPVIFDDGGSIRIRLFEKGGPGKMDGLPKVNNKKSEHEVVDPTENYKQAFIVWAKDDGTAGQEPVVLTPSILTLWDDLNEIKVEVSAAGKRLKITISGTNINPDVREVQHSGKFSYTVSNAGHINQIQLEKGRILGPLIYASVVIV